MVNRLPVGLPRYNVVSARLTDEEKEALTRACKGRQQSEYVRQIILEKLQEASR